MSPRTLKARNPIRVRQFVLQKDSYIGTGCRTQQIAVMMIIILMQHAAQKLEKKAEEWVDNFVVQAAKKMANLMKEMDKYTM